MLLSIISLLVICSRLCHASSCIYDRYTAEPASDELLQYFDSEGLTSTCTLEVEDCDPTERRRVDGSCNNLANPVRGTYFEPVYRLLPAVYSNGSLPRTADDGTALEMPRVVRNTLLMEGKASSLKFTQSVPGYGIFTFGDIGSIHDILQFVRDKTDCCTEEGKKSPKCSNIYIRDDDPVHRFSNVRCMNLTTPLIYSDFGCTNDTKPSPIEHGTATLDMSHIYADAGRGDEALRTFVNGLLAVETDNDGTIWPPNGNGYCAANQPGETRCFGHYPTALLSGMLYSIWYMRQHNYFATQLALVNPHWDDETLFQTARDINIAFAAEVFLRGWAKAIMGETFLIENNVISDNDGYRNIYNESMFPQVSLEFTYVLRWFHTMQEGSAYMYDTDGTFLKEYPYVNVTFRPGFLGVDKNIVYATQHLFRQSAAEIDYAVDPDISQNGLPYIQHAVDITASDLYKSRLLGFAPYIDYVYWSTGHKITCFDDLSEHMEPERIKQMKKVYPNVTNIDVLAGMWGEKIMEGGSIPKTLAFIIVEFLAKLVRYDRHWYELSDRPHYFNEAQLAEVRKSSLSLLMCNVADGVSEIQPNAFLTISEDNPLTSCANIPSLDFSAWADSSSDSDTSSDSTTDSTSDSTTDSTADFTTETSSDYATY